MSELNKLNNDLGYYHNYFNGINDIQKGDVGKGILKLLSYATLIVPAYFKFQEYQTEAKIDQLKYKLSNAVQNNSDSLPQKDFITFLTLKAEESTYDDAFKSAFTRLTPESQNAFFEEIMQRGKIVEVTRQLPKNIKEINLNFGNSLFQEEKFNEVNGQIEQVMNNLQNYPELEKATIELTQVYRINERTQKRLAAIAESNKYVTNPTIVYNSKEDVLIGQTIKPNNIKAAEMTMNKSIELFKKMNKLNNLEIKLKDENQVTINRNANDKAIKVNIFNKDVIIDK